jgi:uncharacterized protein (TIGR02996 family)
MTELEEALVAFAAHRSSELTRVIEVLGTAALGGFVTPAAKSNTEFQRAWCELAVEPARRTWCLEMLSERLPPKAKQAALIERLDVLRDVAPDPRIARAAIVLLGRNLTFVYGPVYDELAQIVIRHGDDTTGSTPQLATILRAASAQRMLASSSLPVPTPLDPEVAARWATVAPPPQRDAAELYDAVYAALDTDEPRTVLADALQERGDPRGELIALQLLAVRGEATEVVRERERELLRKHGKTWLGELRKITLRAELRRGFLYRLELAGAWVTDHWDVLAMDPSLRTVEELYAGQASTAVFSQFLAGLVHRSLRTIDVEDDATWDVVRTNAMPRLRELRSFHWKGRPSYDERFAKRVVPFLERTPAITRIGCLPAMLAACSKALIARLTDLAAPAELEEGVRLWQSFPHLHTFETGHLYQPVTLVRDNGGELARVDLRGNRAMPDLTALPASITRVEILNNMAEGKRLAARGTRFDVIVVPPLSAVVTGA